MKMRYDNLSSIKTSSLLKMKVSDLQISFEESSFVDCLDKLHSELANKKLSIRPKIWGSDDWFCPDGHTSFAVPFTLFHPRLIELEKEFVGHLEGTTINSFMKLARHECGHILDNAYKLKTEKNRIEIFGDHNIDYPSSYIAKKYSKKFVKHLEQNYAQAHPEEDWAETFAVWLSSSSNWKTKYELWPAIDKLKYVNKVMKSIQAKRMLVRNDFFYDHFKSMNLTLEKYFQLKKTNHRQRFNLRHLSSIVRVGSGDYPLCDVIASKRSRIIERLVRETRYKRYELVKSLENLELNAHRKNLRINRVNTSIKVLSEISLVHSRKFLDDGKHRIIM